jgi:hypothetical protein
MTILCLLYIIHCILNIFLRSDLLSTNSSLKDCVLPCYVAESWALLPQVKHLGIKLMHKSRWLITQVYNGQLTHVTESLTHRELQRDLFFHCAQRYAVWEAACHLWCRVTAKWPIQQCVLTTMNQTTFQLCMPGGLNLDIHILILINIYIYYLNLYNNIYIWTSCTLRHIAGLIKQWQMYVDKCTLLDKYTIDHFWTFLTGKPYPALEAPENNCLSSSVKADKHTKLQQSNHATQRFWWIRRHMFKMQKSKNKSN